MHYLLDARFEELKAFTKDAPEFVMERLCRAVSKYPVDYVATLGARFMESALWVKNRLSMKEYLYIDNCCMAIYGGEIEDGRVYLPEEKAVCFCVRSAKESVEEIHKGLQVCKKYKVGFVYILALHGYLEQTGIEKIRSVGIPIKIIVDNEASIPESFAGLLEAGVVEITSQLPFIPSE